MIEFPVMADFCRAVILIARPALGDRPGMAIRVEVHHVRTGLWRIQGTGDLRPAGVTDEMVQQVKRAMGDMTPHAMTAETAAAVIEVGMLHMTAAAHARLGGKAA